MSIEKLWTAPTPEEALPLREQSNEMLAFHDPERLIQAINELRSHAEHDPLTGVYNRRGFEHQAKNTLTRHTHEDNGGVGVAVLVDVDDFKKVNDVHGHAAGDKSLIAIAEILTTSSRPGDIVARLGGDEYVVLLFADKDMGHMAAGRFRARVEDGIGERHDEVKTTVTFGHELLSGPEDLDRALDAADKRLYERKQHRKNGSK